MTQLRFLCGSVAVLWPIGSIFPYRFLLGDRFCMMNVTADRFYWIYVWIGFITSFLLNHCAFRQEIDHNISVVSDWLINTNDSVNTWPVADVASFQSYLWARFCSAAWIKPWVIHNTFTMRTSHLGEGLIVTWQPHNSFWDVCYFLLPKMLFPSLFQFVL